MGKCIISILWMRKLTYLFQGHLASKRQSWEFKADMSTHETPMASGVPMPPRIWAPTSHTLSYGRKLSALLQMTSNIKGKGTCVLKVTSSSQLLVLWLRSVGERTQGKNANCLKLDISYSPPCIAFSYLYWEKSSLWFCTAEPLVPSARVRLPSNYRLRVLLCPRNCWSPQFPKQCSFLA